MPRHLIFNVDFEESLAGRRARIEPRFLRKLASRFLFLGTADDTYEGDFELPAAFRERFALPLPGSGGGPGRGLLEWAPTQPAALVRRVNSKAWSHALAKRLGLAPPGAALCHSVAEVERELAHRGEDGRWVLKRAFGHGGRGHFLGAGRSLPENARGWLATALSCGEPVVFEPWGVREADYSTQLLLDGSILLLGATEMLTTPQGGYLGSRVGTVPWNVKIALERTAADVGAALHDEGYRGPAGVDAYSSDGLLRPLVEVNARHTMGRIALAIAKRLGREVASWLTLPGPLAIAESGPWWAVTDPWPDEEGPATVLLWASSRAELLAREEELRAAAREE